MKAQLLILDFGSQVTQLIARTVRELGVYCEIVPGTIPAAVLKEKEPKALILSGGPASVNAPEAPQLDAKILDLGLPVFGICYGMQLLAKHCGGKVGGWGENKEEETREFGPATVKVTHPVGPFSIASWEPELKVWMSHGDRVTGLPSGFEVTGTSDGCEIAAFANQEKQVKVLNKWLAELRDRVYVEYKIKPLNN